MERILVASFAGSFVDPVVVTQDVFEPQLNSNFLYRLLSLGEAA